MDPPVCTSSGRRSRPSLIARELKNGDLEGEMARKSPALGSQSRSPRSPTPKSKSAPETGKPELRAARVRSARASSKGTKRRSPPSPQEDDEDGEDGDGDEERVDDGGRPRPLPLHRVNKITKLDKDTRTNKEAIFAISKATECFVRQLAARMGSLAKQRGRRAVDKAAFCMALHDEATAHVMGFLYDEFPRPRPPHPGDGAKAGGKAAADKRVASPLTTKTPAGATDKRTASPPAAVELEEC